MDRIVVTAFLARAFLYAVVYGILHFSDNIHPNMHADSSLLDDLC
jgi:hypothetical protein